MFKPLRNEKALAALSILSMLLFFFIMAVYYKSIPDVKLIIRYVWRGWFLPIEGIIVLVGFAAIILIASGCGLVFQKAIGKRLFNVLSQYWWVGARVYSGFTWIGAGLTIWTRFAFIDTDFAKLIAELSGVGSNLPPTPYPWYNSFLANLILPNAPLFARVIQYLELLVGFCLLLGLLTNLGAAIAIFLNVNFFFAVGWIHPAIAAQTLFIALLEVLFILLRIGRRFGVDEYLAKEYPHAIVW